MHSSIPLILYAAPAALLLAALVPLGPRGAHRATMGAGLVAFTLALFAWLAVQIVGPGMSPVLGWGSLGFAIALDPLSTTLAFLVTFVGLLVVRYSRQYLDGDPGQARFFRGLTLTLAAVLFLVLSGNLVQLFAGWMATSLALHRLLLFYPERPGARRAAFKKFVVARLGDAALLSALLVLYSVYGEADIHRLAELAAGSPRNLGVVGILLALAAMLKSAQFPTHGWLLEVMETPTPVSALLHAGIINAGGFLIVRFATVMSASPVAMDVLALIGATTAIFGSLVMLTETRVKVSLAYSTIAQMGFMLLQCGLGAYALAVLHIVAHSLYKAHGFLSSGSAVIVTKRAPPGPAPTPAVLLGAFLLSAVIFAATASAASMIGPVSIPVLALGSVLVLGSTQYLALSGAERSTVARRGVLAASVVSILYFGFELAAEHAFEGTLPLPAALSVFDVLLLTLTVLAFAAATIIQLTGGLEHRWLRRIHVHLKNGLYTDLILDQLVGARRRSDARSSSW